MKIIGQIGVKQICNERHNYDLSVPKFTDNFLKKYIENGSTPVVP